MFCHFGFYLRNLNCTAIICIDLIKDIDDFLFSKILTNSTDKTSKLLQT